MEAFRNHVLVGGSGEKIYVSGDGKGGNTPGKQTRSGSRTFQHQYAYDFDARSSNHVLAAVLYHKCILGANHVTGGQ